MMNIIVGQRAAAFLFLSTFLLGGCWWDGNKSSPPATYTIGGTISGLASAGLVLANGSDTVSPSATATSFNFNSALAQGANYSVTVQTQPSGASCAVASGAGTVGAAAVTSVQVTCAALRVSLGGSISGLTASGLVLGNGSDRVSPASGASSFTFPQQVASGATYAVSVITQPTGLNCSVTNGSGTVATWY